MSSFGNSPGMHLQDLILDTKATATKEQKVECLKLLRIVVKNLADPLKSQDPKYRQLRLSNEKVRAKLLPCPSAKEYMKAIGFAQVTDGDGAEYLRIEADKEVNVVNMQASLVELTNAVEMVDPNALSGGKKSPANSAPPSRSSSVGSFGGEEKKTPEGIIVRRSDSALSTSSASSSTGKMTEKQKARLLMEQKRKREQEEAKEARARTSAQIKADKYVRMNDPNWKSGQSAACVKSGTGISTFRDKYGEGEN
uniref:PUB domain-containing protein n=1 Tax=Odontella aurita TaxID=265563 RepID=A0A7S4KCB2_9STRA|mmetsp:Transcript_9230/g.27818  ORF Transcript_9230/g.27818 Transcript_9230/m.27818 type:complete len:253 (+) Transcript_9230:310-1068(+)